MPRKKKVEDINICDRAKRLNYVLNFARISHHEICDNTTVKLDTLYRWSICKKHSVSKKGAIKIVEYLRKAGIVCNLNWLMENDGPEPYRDFSLHQFNQQPKTDFSTEIEFFLNRNQTAIGTTLSDNTMAPYFEADDYVGGYRNTPTEKLIGQTCLVQTANHPQILLRRVEKGSQDNRYTLLCTSPNETTPLAQPDVEIIMAAKVIFIRKPS